MSAVRRVTAVLITLAAMSGCADDSGTATEPEEASTSTHRPHGTEPIAIDDAGQSNPGRSGADQSGADQVDIGSGGSAAGRPLGLRLAPFSDCSAFLEHVKQEAVARVGPYGLDGGGYPFAIAELAVEESATAEAAAATMAPAAAADSSAVTAGPSTGDDESDGGAAVTGTNTQEAGIDEPDIIKADGTRVVTISDNVLTVTDITGDEPVVTGSLQLGEGWDHQMFLNGDRALILTNSGGWASPTVATTDIEASFADVAAPSMPYEPSLPAATLIDVDLSRPGEIRVTATLRIEGQYLSARMIDDRVVMAVSTGAQWMPWLYPQSPGGEERAEEANRALVAESQLSDWVPEYELVVGETVSGGDVLACDRVHHPAQFSGFDMITVIDIDLGAGLATGFDPAAASGVLAGGQTVYASVDRLYVATTRWARVEMLNEGDELETWSEDFETDIHAFSIAAGESPRYVASGTVPGSMLNQFSMDEHAGHIRVFVTDGAPWNQADLSETSLVVLQEQGDRLVTVGEVGGLGRGEALYAARMIGDRGFAVTFRQVDPLYVLDLSDPTNPQVTGELKIPGFSTYLHPVGDHRVLGVGRDATDDGAVTGLKLSLFDVSDPAAPTELAVWTLADASSQAEYDHHAFQMIGSTAILPVQSWTDGFNGAVVFDIGDTISELGRISHVATVDEPTTECRPVTTGDVAETSVLYWMTVDPNVHLQMCDADDASGYGSWYCDVVPIDQVAAWYGTDEAATELAALGLGPDGRMETCYRSDDGSLQAIQRSVVIDGELWTMSRSRLEAYDLATLAPLGGVTLG